MMEKAFPMTGMHPEVGKWKVEDPTTRKVMNAGPDMGKHDVRISSGSSDKVRKRPSLTYLAFNY
jgi:hypothetical protein